MGTTFYPNYTNHKCKILIDPDGNKLEEPIIVKYHQMISELKPDHLKTFMTAGYLGHGEIYSVCENGKEKKVKSGSFGHFFSRAADWKNIQENPVLSRMIVCL